MGTASMPLGLWGDWLVVAGIFREQGEGVVAKKIIILESNYRIPKFLRIRNFLHVAQGAGGGMVASQALPFTGGCCRMATAVKGIWGSHVPETQTGDVGCTLA